MPDIRPYDPTDIKEMNVGVADYRKAKAGEAFASLAKGLGQVRDQVASNAEQRIAGNTGLASQAIGGLAHIAQAVVKATAQQNAMLANHAATTDYYDAMKAWDKAQDGMTQEYSNPDLTPKLTENTDHLLTKNYGPPDALAIANDKGQGMDYRSIMSRASNNPVYKSNPAALTHLDSMLQASIYQRVRMADHVARNMMTAQAVQFGKSVVDETKAAANALPADPNQALQQFNKRALVAQTAIDQNQSVAGAGATAKLSQDLATEAPPAYVDAMVNKQINLVDAQGKPDPLKGGVNLDMLQKQVHSSAFSHLDPKDIAGFDKNIDRARDQLLDRYKIDDTGKNVSFQLWATQTATDINRKENRNNTNFQENAISKLEESENIQNRDIQSIQSDPAIPAQFKVVTIDRLRKNIESIRILSDRAQAHIQHKETEEGVQQRHNQAEQNAQFRFETQQFNENQKAEKERKTFEAKVSADEAQTELDRLGQEMTEMNPATQQQEMVKKAEELAQYAGRAHLAGHLTENQANTAQKAADKLVRASQEYVPDRSWWGLGPTTGTYTHQSSVSPNGSTDKAADDKIRERQVKALAKVSQIQKGYQLAIKYSAQAKLAGLDEKQQTKFNTMADGIITNWQDGKLQDWDRDKKLNGLLGFVQKTEPKTPVPSKPVKGTGVRASLGPGNGTVFVPPPPPTDPSLMNLQPRRMTRSELAQQGIVVSDTKTPGDQPGGVDAPSDKAMPQGNNWQMQFAKPGPYITELSPDRETKFQEWVKENNVPFDPSPHADYDMRGYYKNIVLKGKAETENKTDGVHYPDTYKTPYHHSFSSHSKYATKDAPHWVDGDILIGKDGKVYFNEPLWIAQHRKDEGAP